MRSYESYFDYERDLGRGVVARFLVEEGISLDGKRVLDVGCGEGGVLAGLAETWRFEGLGIEYDAQMLARAKPTPGVTLRHADFYTCELPSTYDFVLIRDVLEHCGDPEGMLRKAGGLLAPGGRIYLTYTPFLSPFGGHQHNGSGVFSNVPYLQVLPQRLFLRLVKPGANLYKGGDPLVQDLNQVRKTRLTTGKVRRAASSCDLEIITARGYVVRPDYEYKFGLRPLPFPSALEARTLTDVCCTCVEMLLRRRGDAAPA